MLYNLFNRFGHLDSVLYQRRKRRALLQFASVDQAFLAKEFLNNQMLFTS